MEQVNVSWVVIVQKIKQVKFSTKLTTKHLQLIEGNIKRKILPWQESKKSSVAIFLSLEARRRKRLEAFDRIK